MEIRAARIAISTIFFVNGAVLASWVPHLPAIKTWHDAGDARLGLVLLAMAGGAVVTLPLAGRLIAWLGDRFTTSVAALGLCVAMPLPVLGPSLLVVAAALAVLGACNGLLDVSMNAQAAAVERRAARRVMSSFHGLFSLGGMAGASLAAGAMRVGLSDVRHVVVAAAVSAGAVVLSLPWLLPSRLDEGSAGPGLAWPPRAVLTLGLFAALALLAEGAMADWSAVYLRDVSGADASLAATGFAAFSLAMAVGRFGGDSLVGRFGSRTLLRTSGAVATLGLGGALLAGRPLVGVAGFALVGLGIANIIPVLFGTAARTRGVAPPLALSAVATMGYLGFLAGPPLIGIVAEVGGLSVGLALVCAACALIAGPGARCADR